MCAMMEDKADDSLHRAAPGVTRQGMNQAFVHGPILLSGEGQGHRVAGLDEWEWVLQQVQLPREVEQLDVAQEEGVIIVRGT